MYKKKLVIFLLLITVFCGLAFYFSGIYEKTSNDNSDSPSAQQEKIIQNRIFSTTNWGWIKNTKLIAYEVFPRFNAEEYLLRIEEVPPQPEGALEFGGAESAISATLDTFITHNINNNFDDNKNIWSVLIITDSEQHNFTFIYDKNKGGYLHYGFIDKTKASG